MSLYEVLSTFATCIRLEEERKRGRMPDDQEYDEYLDMLASLQQYGDVVIN